MTPIGAEISAPYLEGEISLRPGGDDRRQLAAHRSCPGSRRDQGSCGLGRALPWHSQGLPLPARRAHSAGAGTARNVTLFNCFVMGTIEDSIPGIFRALQEGALTMQQGGGIGYDFSTLRPRARKPRRCRHDRVRSRVLHAGVGRDVRHHPVHRRASRRHDGDAALRSSRHRRVHRRQAAAGTLRRFNLSVQVTDAFMAAVRQDVEWPLVFPAATFDGRRRNGPARLARRSDRCQPRRAAHPGARALGEHPAGDAMTMPSPACCSSTVSTGSTISGTASGSAPPTPAGDSRFLPTEPAISARSIWPASSTPFRAAGAARF